MNQKISSFCSLLISVIIPMKTYSLTIEDAHRWEDINSKPETGNLHNPAYFIAEETMILLGVQCRQGFNNISSEFDDAINHCSRMNHIPKLGLRRGKYSHTNQTVDFGGPTPLICLSACVSQHAGLVNENGTGLNETAIKSIFLEGFINPGGEFSVHVLTRELMDCDEKYPTTFPMQYSNCTQQEDLFRCFRKVMLDCTDKMRQHGKEFIELKGSQTSRKSSRKSKINLLNK